ncbi:MULTISPECIES: sigma-54-dependent Fis family transcriptional regulator [unclassified Halanaerobium]|uniref:sigma-54-dependent Fis family transcriptional regulator n=1 Tax=unclassified Halanaerobium TaxID=2641197 RepID=UPI000DF37E3F|nr:MULTISPECIES: sigma-54-dependent Fis family transcriptional regulator [unclassified Halanaerobium]RCW44131.1 PAS domain S-box-containing protein [Halanaerobium sp. MA284_MarDTE_T2]RCW86989.1 PAS domain S-box-containing protein [Halanaerobium sp. DL-01]
MHIFNKKAYQEWKSFVEKGEISDDFDKNIITESWHRCKNLKVDPYGGEGNIIEKKLLMRIRKANRDLIEIARPFMNELAEIVENSNFVVVLTDSRGMIVEVTGDEKIMNRAMEMRFTPGSYWSEEKVGTNAIGTGIKVDKPLQVVGEEHYCKKHHPWTCSAAPIHNPEGELIGILDMTGPCECAHPHTLGMVAAAAQAVEHQLALMERNRELEQAHEFATAVINSMSEGLISINKMGSIISINQAAARMLNIKKENALNKDIKDVLGEQKVVEKMLSEHRIFNDEDIYLHGDGKKIYFNSSARMLPGGKGIPDGFIIILRRMKAVKKMVNRIAGSEARFKFDDIIGNSSSLNEVVEMAKIISDSDAAVLIEGESGTGKEMMAQAIHNSSPRREQVFLSINCAAIPQSLLESELFGYEGGSFTGARKKGRPGKFELASGGTLHLDEIGEMPLNMQASLLRVLQEKEITRIGGLEPILVDVRIIASTNKVLEEEVKKGNFRKDLYFRLNTVNLKMPPLRERTEDIPLLIEHFISIVNQQSNKDIYGVEEEVIKILQNYSWPGNVRELQNLIERAALLSDDGVIRSDLLPDELKKEKTSVPLNPEKIPLLKIDQMEEILINLSLKKSKNITQAAEKLGISRSTIYRKAQKYNIDL